MKTRLLKKLRRHVANQFYLRKRPDSDRCDLYRDGKEVKFYISYVDVVRCIREVTHDYMASYVAKRKRNVYIW